MNIITIIARDLPDAWFQFIYNILKYGREFKIDKGSYAGNIRLEYDYITIQITHPQNRPLLPDIPEHYGIPNPVDEDFLNQYVAYLMTSDKQPNEQYTYGERLVDYKNHVQNGAFEFINQMDKIIEIYKKYGYRNNQLVLQVADPADIKLDDPPCLRHIDTRIQDEKLHFIIYFRSWDLWGGFPANLAAIAHLQEYMAGEIGVQCGEFICSSKGLHLYSFGSKHDPINLAKIRCMIGDNNAS